MPERKDVMGDRLKAYEKIETQQFFLPNSYLYVRVDGRSFSKFTKGLERPYDERLSLLMREVTKYLVKEFNCVIGYTQSDEINLIIENSYEKSCVFNAKKQKLISTIASSAGALFNALLPSYIPEKVFEVTGRLPTFDCRIFVLPSKEEAINALLWREFDAIKNSISMLAHHHFSPSQLYKVNCDLMKDMLKTQKNEIWEEYSKPFRSGTYSQRKLYQLPIGDGHVIRSAIFEVEVELTKLSHEDRMKLVFAKENETDTLDEHVDRYYVAALGRADKVNGNNRVYKGIDKVTDELWEKQPIEESQLAK